MVAETFHPSYSFSRGLSISAIQQSKTLDCISTVGMLALNTITTLIKTSNSGDSVIVVLHRQQDSAVKAVFLRKPLKALRVCTSSCNCFITASASITFKVDLLTPKKLFCLSFNWQVVDNLSDK